MRGDDQTDYTWAVIMTALGVAMLLSLCARETNTYIANPTGTEYSK